MQWQADTPIYLQLRQQIVDSILSGQFKEGDAIPSIRQVSADYALNHLTVAKAFQLLVDEGVLEKRRGVGMFVKSGARDALAEAEKARFLEEEWPKIRQRIQKLGIDWEVLKRHE